MENLRNLDYEELKALLISFGEQAYRADQIYGFLHKKFVSSFSEMTNIGSSLRNRLENSFHVDLPEAVMMLESRIDGTRKYAFRMADGQIVESVFMRYRHGNSVCVSSQAGCRMGCRFCASTLHGLQRNLSCGEMLSQVYMIQKDTGERVSNIVIMGSGEPLDNYDETIRFVRMLSDSRGINISQRNITLSSCGLVPEIYRLSDEGFGLTLAISLHAPNDSLRRYLMPVAARYPVGDLLKAASAYFERTGRRISFEYSLIEGVNDSPQSAAELSGVLSEERARRKMQCHVNLIPVNPVKERGFRRPDRGRLELFLKRLNENGIPATIRREMGADISGACGQLRASLSEP